MIDLLLKQDQSLQVEQCLSQVKLFSQPPQRLVQEWMFVPQEKLDFVVSSLPLSQPEASINLVKLVLLLIEVEFEMVLGNWI